MKYEIQTWLNYEYPSHWSTLDHYTTLEAAKVILELFKKNHPRDDFRLIQVLEETT